MGGAGCCDNKAFGEPCADCAFDVPLAVDGEQGNRSRPAGVLAVELDSGGLESAIAATTTPAVGFLERGDAHEGAAASLYPHAAPLDQDWMGIDHHVGFSGHETAQQVDPWSTMQSQQVAWQLNMSLGGAMFDLTKLIDDLLNPKDPRSQIVRWLTEAVVPGPALQTLQLLVPPTPPWWYHLPPCPLEEAAVTEGKDNEKWCSEGDSSYHPGAAACYRQVGGGGKPGQQCCYDKNGDLIVEGRGAGTPDQYASAVGRDEKGNCEWDAGSAALHWLFDVRPFRVMGGSVGHHVLWPPSGSKEDKRQREEYQKKKKEYEERRKGG